MHPTTGATVAVWAQYTAGGTPALLFRIPQGTANLPTGAKYQPYNRGLADANDLTPASGVLTLMDVGELIAGDSVASVTFYSGGTGSTGLTHSWAALVAKDDRAVLGKTIDDTTAWAAFGVPRTFTFTAPVTIPTTKEYYVGIVEVATTPAMLRGKGTYQPLRDLVPRVVANSTTGLNVPGDLGATAAPFANAPSGAWPYFWLA